jgi:hypothetical protein
VAKLLDRGRRPGAISVFAPLALIFVVFVTVPVIALAWRAFDSGELTANLTS